MQTNANSVLMGGSAAPRLDTVLGAYVGGQIVGFDEYHCREYDANNPGGGPLRYFPSGDPIKGLWVDVRTSERNDADDDGVRRLYVEKPRMLKAVREACVAAGCKDGIDVDGVLYVAHTGTEKGKGGTDANTYAAQYTPSPRQANGAMNVPAPATQAITPVATQSIPVPPPSIPGVAFGVNATPPPAWATAPAAPAAPVAAPVAPTQVDARPTITAQVAAAMVNAGVDVSGFNIVG